MSARQYFDRALQATAVTCVMGLSGLYSGYNAPESSTPIKTNAVAGYKGVHQFKNELADGVNETGWPTAVRVILKTAGWVLFAPAELGAFIDGGIEGLVEREVNNWAGEKGPNPPTGAKKASARTAPEAVP
jgi:hypothetical protein